MVLVAQTMSKPPNWTHAPIAITITTTSTRTNHGGAMRKCHRCGAEWDGIKRVPGVKEFCTSCSGYLHCCLNCRHHNPAYHNQCAIPNTVWVGDKAGANFCDEFEFRDMETDSIDAKAAPSARNPLDALFGDAPRASDTEKLDQFKKLFGD